MILPVVRFRLRRDGQDRGVVTLADLHALFAADLAALPPWEAQRVRVDAGVCGWRLNPLHDVWLPPGLPGEWFEYWAPKRRARAG